MNIKNVDHANNWAIRDRAIKYWQNNVIANHLPTIDQTKREEMKLLKQYTTQSSHRRGMDKSDFDFNQSLH